MSQLLQRWSQSSDVSQMRPSYRFLSYFSFIQMRWGEFGEPHVCSLIDMMRKTDIVKEIIDSGILIGFRRCLERSFMISRHHPYTKTVFKSLTEIRNEEVRQMLSYRGMIHPFSMFCLYYEFIMALMTIIYLIFILPADMAYLSFYPTVTWMKFVFDIIMTLSVIINFSIGYWDKNNMDVTLHSKAVARHYLRTFLAWDVLSCIPTYTIGIYFFSTSLRWKLIKWLSLARTVRIITIDKALDMFRAYCGVPVELYVATQILLWSYLVVLCCMALMTFLGQLPYLFDDVTKEKDKAIAQMAIFASIRALFGVGQLEIAYTYPEALAAILITMIAYVLQIWIMAKLYILWQRFLILSEVGEDHYQQLAGYLKYKGLPPNIREDIYCYYEFRFQKRFYEESAILSMLSENLRKEIPSYRLDKTIEKIRFIRLLPNPVIRQVLSNMEPCYYCPGDVIFRVNSPAKILYFIRSGTVALHDENNVELCHLEDGSYYGDVSVILNQFHYVTMTAVAPCKIFRLNHYALMQILDTMPEVKERVFELTRKMVMYGRKDWASHSFGTRNVTVWSERDSHLANNVRISRSLTYI